MRFVMLVKASVESEAGVLPDEKILSEMGRFNDEMVKAGVMLAGEGLQGSSKGTRIRYSAGEPTVIDGPFDRVEELVAGFWLIQARSKEEAVEWSKRVPFQDGEVEVRQVFELSDFPQDPAEEPDGWRAQEQRQRVRSGLAEN